jgi:ketosteroid isomerase-like protein
MSEENVEIVVFTVRDGRVAGIQGYIDPVAALEAAGLPD